MAHRLLILGTTVMMLTAAAASAQDRPAADGVPDSHLFFGGTARSLPAGEGYFSLRELGLPTFQIGITDRFSVGAGTPLMIPGRIAWFSPKYEMYRGPSTSVAAGLIHVAAFGEGGITVAYGVATTGNAGGAVSYGVGVARGFSDDSSGHILVGMVGGQRRLSARTAFVTENYLVAGVAMVSGGVRHSRGRFSADLGLMTMISREGLVPPGPIINLAWKF